MKYAADNTISSDPIENGIEITDQQYGEALVEMQNGNSVKVDNGKLVFVKPEQPKVENENSALKEETA